MVDNDPTYPRYSYSTQGIYLLIGSNYTLSIYLSKYVRRFVLGESRNLHMCSYVSVRLAHLMFDSFIKKKPCEATQ